MKKVPWNKKTKVLVGGEVEGVGRESTGTPMQLLRHFIFLSKLVALNGEYFPFNG